MIDVLLAFAALADSPTIALKLLDDTGELQTICMRESQCDADVAAHEIDVWYGARAYKSSLRVGALSSKCVWHYRGDVARWSTHYLYGQVVAYAIPYLGCVPTQLLSFAIVDTWVAKKRLRRAKRRDAPRRLKTWANLM